MSSTANFNPAEPNENSSKTRHCVYCGKPITRSAEFNCCYFCEDTILFDKVKEYIRDNNVTEIQVAKHFAIPLRIVKQWIREDRLGYRR